MDTLNISIFVQAAHGGSLSEAARRLGLTPAVASRRLGVLEDDLGVRLAHRTTRRFSLTAEGAGFLPHAVSILEIERDVRASVAGSSGSVEGLLRVGAPFPLSRRVVVPALRGLLAAHPELRVDLQLTDAYVDMVKAGLDVVLRVAHLEDSGHIARRLAPSPRVLCASPGYLRSRGRPMFVADLQDHDCLVRSGASHWGFEEGEQGRQVRIRARLSSNSHLSLRAACVEGMGIAQYALWDATDDLESGQLELVTLDLPLRSDASVWAIYPTRTLLPARVRVFVEAIRAQIGAS
ncbi:MAG: DNA-binding transcriptional LysR family regulator [Bradymonadia bacterium]|jgi:DNA-binding transcriptional LysR family regulator